MGSLNLISLGLTGKKDMSIKAFEKARKCDILYLEDYTHYMNFQLKELIKFIGRPIKKISRKELEEDSNKIIEEAKIKNIGILVGGDCLTATTHSILILDAKKNKIKTIVIHGSSIITAVAETGLFIYNFGKVISVPFQDVDLISSLKENKDLHTLFLLDLDPKENKFVSVNEALKRLLNQGMENRLCVGVERLGFNDQKIVVKNAKELIKVNFNKYPQCLIIPGRLHFVEEEVLDNFK